MPTPVSSAKQCLTEEAARALDDAVKVACRRNHTQTTSLHAVSALLALPSSALRAACARARSGAYSPRLQSRALDLSVGVALDRLPSSRAAVVDEPPVSNSLMAAIKRSQANQRRHPETFHLYQQAQQQNPFYSISCVKVELKHFILSILDDPIVSRIFGESGYRSSDLKLAILSPPPISRFSRSKCPPPLFLCNFSDWESNRHNSVSPLAGFDENSRRIGEVLLKKKAKNPLLIGACAVDALCDFTECVQSNKHGVLPDSIDGSSVISMEKEIREFVCEGGSEAIMKQKFVELSDIADPCNGCGVIVNYGDLKVFVNGGLGDSVRYVVDKLSKLVEIYGEKLWLIGAVGDYETYMEFVAQFALVDINWDLQLLPVTSSKSINGCSYSKNSLMGSFVPFAGFFPTPSEFQNLTNQTFTRCKLCNEKCKEEVEGRSAVSVSDHHSANLPSWLLSDQTDTIKSVSVNAIEAKDESMLKARLISLQRKWSDICWRLHHNIPKPGFQTPNYDAFCRKNANKNEINSQDSSLSETTFTNLSSPTNSSITSVTTDLGLGTLYTPSKTEPEKSIFKNHNKVIKNASDPKFGRQFDGKDSKCLSKILLEKVGYQAEAMCKVSQAISLYYGSRNRGDVWLSFLGPDKVGKKRIASALAEIVFGSRENLISVNLSSEEDTVSLIRGKTVVDCIADELIRKPRSVVFLENLDKADFLVQHSLSRAIKTGKFPDSYGREISLNGMIFITASSIKNANQDEGKYSEQRILGAKQSQMQIIVENVTTSMLRISGSNAVHVNKRKWIDISESQENSIKVRRACLDLNLPVEEIEEENNEEKCERDSSSENQIAWLEDFLEQVDEKVVFESFDFDALSLKILNEIWLIFRENVGVDVRLEIEEEVLVQMLAASWASYKKGGIENWIQEVLCRSFVEVKRKYRLTNGSLVKLVASEGVIVENDEVLPHVCLPARIVLR